mmetsp:Transcript_18277/g.43007  ORF Transcript_18277/g.43007 Transcript_18277/m.43007 type:complete len:244 (+) Transcript_18277:119-850(+)
MELREAHPHVSVPIKAFEGTLCLHVSERRHKRTSCPHELVEAHEAIVIPVQGKKGTLGRGASQALPEALSRQRGFGCMAGVRGSDEVPQRNCVEELLEFDLVAGVRVETHEGTPNLLLRQGWSEGVAALQEFSEVHLLVSAGVQGGKRKLRRGAASHALLEHRDGHSAPHVLWEVPLSQTAEELLHAHSIIPVKVETCEDIAGLIGAQWLGQQCCRSCELFTLRATVRVEIEGTKRILRRGEG